MNAINGYASEIYFPVWNTRSIDIVASGRMGGPGFTPRPCPRKFQSTRLSKPFISFDRSENKHFIFRCNVYLSSREDRRGKDLQGTQDPRDDQFGLGEWEAKTGVHPFNLKQHPLQNFFAWISHNGQNQGICDSASSFRPSIGPPDRKSRSMIVT